MPWEITTADLDAMAETYLTAATLVGETIAAAARDETGRLAYSIRGDIMAATPVGKGHPFYPKDIPGQLRASTMTEARVVNEDRAIDVEVVTTQERLAHANLDETGGGYDVTRYVLEGRDAITAPSGGPHSTGKLALLTPWGPRASVKGALPAASPEGGIRPYPDAAYGAIVTASTMFLRRWGANALERIGGLLGVRSDG